jgi:hypothetical protein
MLKAPSRPPTPDDVSREEETEKPGDFTVFGMFCIVAVDEPGGCQAAILRRHQDSVHGSEEAGIVGRDEEHKRSDEY